jgi:hypothetical protein
MKASGELECQGNLDTCTLAQDTDGTFDYAGIGAHWRASLEAYAEAGVVPDYIGIQNNPDYVPDALEPGEACWFLPTEGSVTVSVDGADVEVDYPGYAEALAAVADELAGSSSPPLILAPETSSAWTVSDYVTELDVSQIGALAHHLYGTNPTEVDTGVLETVGQLARGYELPVLQTEMQLNGWDTALLAHHALAVEEAAAYLHGVLAGPPALPTEDAEVMISLSATDFALEDPYHAIRHYALHTDPGWTRVDATSDADDLLTTAWVSPDGDALTVVLINAGSSAIDASLDLGDEASMDSEVIRTVFDGVERSAELGALSAEGVLHVPASAIVTVALQR